MHPSTTGPRDSLPVNSQAMAKKVYLTTPIYYVNSVPHIGTTLTTVIADICARIYRMQGHDVMFLTGTDENGLKVKEAAEKNGKTAKQHTDETSAEFVRVFDAMNVSYDDFIRTTEPRHAVTAQRLFTILRDNGFIFRDKYEGWYDVSSETFFKESDLVDGKSPDGNEVRWVSEDNWFFRLSAFSERLLEHIEANPDWLLPHVRKNEVVSFIKQGLRDVCITRNNPGWGIPMPGDDSKVIYVWFDAVINYLTATGWPDGDWENIWPADVHWMAKEIFTRFHATLWPAMLMGAGLPLPKTVIAHGWFNFGDAKMSKSKGNVIAPLDFVDEIAVLSGGRKEIAVDVVRYSLASLLPYEGDTNYTKEEVYKLYNVDLANDLGNALNRTLAMAHKFVDGVVPEGEIEPEAQAAIDQALASFEAAMKILRINDAADAAMSPIRFVNKYIDTRAPWVLSKAGDPSLPAVIKSMVACLRTAEGMLRPFIPTVCDEIARQLNLPPTDAWSEIGQPSHLAAGVKLGPPVPIFPRLDLKEIQKKAMEQTPAPAPVVAPVVAPAAEELISIDDFVKVKLKVGRVLEAEPIEGSDRLLKLQIVIGEDKRQIVAGIKKNYTPEDLIGRQVIVCVNLKPAKLRGVESQGMLLAATDEEGGAILLQPDKEAPEGTGVK